MLILLIRFVSVVITFTTCAVIHSLKARAPGSAELLANMQQIVDVYKKIHFIE